MTQLEDDYLPEDPDPVPDDPLAATEQADPEDKATPPPHDLDAEAAVLSAVMLDSRRAATIDFLQHDHFFSEAHRRTYEAVLELRSEGAVVDVVTVGSRLKDRGRLAQVGGMPYLGSILDSAPVIANLRAYAMTVFEKWRLRQTILTCERFAARGYERGITDVQKHVDEVLRTLGLIGRNSPASSSEPQWMVLRRLYAEMAEAAKLEPSGGRTPGLPTGIRSFDLKTLGLKPGGKITVMAERGRGKTSFALQVAMHAAGWRGRRQPLADRRVAVKFFSCEMPKEDIAVKMMSLAARVDSRRIERQRAEPTLSQEEWDRIGEAMPLLERVKLSVDDRSDLTPAELMSELKQACAQSVALDGLPLGLAVIDYVQRLKVPADLLKRREDEQIGEATKLFTETAKELQIPIMELAQMNTPDPKQSKTGKPYEGLAAQCKRIEKEAYAVHCIWRKTRGNLRDYMLTCTKLRGGEEFEIELEFEPEYSTFIDPAYKGFASAFDDFA